MRKLLIIGLLTFPTLSSAVASDSEGASFITNGGCYAQSYSDDYLNTHPDQNIKFISLASVVDGDKSAFQITTQFIDGDDYYHHALRCDFKSPVKTCSLDYLESGYFNLIFDDDGLKIDFKDGVAIVVQNQKGEIYKETIGFSYDPEPRLLGDLGANRKFALAPAPISDCHYKKIEILED